MILTDKCLEDFRKYLSYNHGLDLNDWELQKLVFSNALIIEFFDSKKYFISIELRKDHTEVKIIDFTFFISYYYPDGELQRIKHDCVHDYLIDARNQATATAIEKANGIYNLKHQ